MIKALIIDDEPSAINTLRLMLERYVPEITDLHFTSNPEEALEIIQKTPPDILFLDIQMPLMNGFELLRKVPSINFKVIFTTAHDQYAIQAIRFSAFDYLLKPIDADELRGAINIYLQRNNTEQVHDDQYKNLLNNITATNKQEFRLAIPTDNGMYFYSPDEIIRLEGESNYTRLFFTDKKPLLVSKTLKEYDEILADHGFIRVHKSHLVNKKYVINYTTDGLLVLTDQSKVEISRRRRDEVIAALKQQ
ncbi:MAG: response regulator transcription factor [Chitinophagaceae bacterium]|nr:response regulator transcription factor [Chitinophagaceae bacterium]